MLAEGGPSRSRGRTGRQARAQLGVRGEEPHRLAGQLAHRPRLASASEAHTSRPSTSVGQPGASAAAALSVATASATWAWWPAATGRGSAVRSRGQDPEGVAQPAQGLRRVGELVVDAVPVRPHGVEQVDGAALVEARSWARDSF